MVSLSQRPHLTSPVPIKKSKIKPNGIAISGILFFPCVCVCVLYNIGCCDSLNPLQWLGFSPINKPQLYPSIKSDSPTQMIEGYLIFRSLLWSKPQLPNIRFAYSQRWCAAYAPHQHRWPSRRMSTVDRSRLANAPNCGRPHQRGCG